MDNLAADVMFTSNDGLFFACAELSFNFVFTNFYAVFCARRTPQFYALFFSCFQARLYTLPDSFAFEFRNIKQYIYRQPAGRRDFPLKDLDVVLNHIQRQTFRPDFLDNFSRFQSVPRNPRQFIDKQRIIFVHGSDKIKNFSVLLPARNNFRHKQIRSLTVIYGYFIDRMVLCLSIFQ